MTVRQIALSAAAILQADDIEETLSTGAEIDDADAKTLVKCVNLAAAEMSDDFPVLKTSTAQAIGGYIPLSAFVGMPSKVYGVKRGGYAVPFSFDSRGIGVASDGEHDVTYAEEYSDALPDDETKLGAGADCGTLVYLAARNYCLVTGRTDEAAIWDQRYNAEVEKKRMARRARLPKRAWL